MIQKTVHCREILRRTNIQLQTVSKHPIDIVGVIDLPVGRAGIVTFYVARNINSEVIIGSDALEQGRAGINFCTKTLGLAPHGPYVAWSQVVSLDWETL